MHSFSEIQAAVEGAVNYRDNVTETRGSYTPTESGEILLDMFIEAVATNNPNVAFSTGLDLQVNIDELRVGEAPLICAVIDRGEDYLAAILMELGGRFVQNGINVALYALDKGMLGLVKFWILSAPALADVSEIASHVAFSKFGGLRDFLLE